MRLICKIGSMHVLSQRKVYHEGDEFSIDDLKGASLIASGYAVPVEPVVVPTIEAEVEPEQEPEPKPTPKTTRSKKR